MTVVGQIYGPAAGAADERRGRCLLRGVSRSRCGCSAVGAGHGWAPRRQDDLPTSIYDYLVRLKADRPHGGRFDYRSCETDVLGWVCERATGRRMPDLLAGLLWSRLGAEKDADGAVDPSGAVLHDGGLASTLRALGRFGQMLADSGQVGDEDIVPDCWLEDAFAGESDSRAAFAADPTTGWLPDGMYRNLFWVPFSDRHVLLCLGIHGQLVWVDRDRRIVVVKLSHWPYPQDLGMLLDTLRAIESISAALHEIAATAGRRVHRGGTRGCSPLRLRGGAGYWALALRKATDRFHANDASSWL